MRCFRCNTWPCSCHDGQTIILGDCQLVMSALPSNHFTAIVTDPPYELAFMGKRWDASGVAFDVATWEAALRVAKPGAPLLAFGGDRTHHRLMVAIEDAGWEIRTCVYWVFGSGFPKSLSIGKAIDRAAGVEREVVGRASGAASANTESLGRFEPEYDATAPSTPLAKQWEGYGTALKPAVEICVVAMKPLDGTFAANAQKHGVAGLNIDAARVEGTVPQTVHGVSSRQGEVYGKYRDEPEPSTVHPAGRFPSTLIHDGSAEAVAGFPERDGATSFSRPKDYKASSYQVGDCELQPGYGDSGSAARFFYCAKAGADERGDSKHPTIKPRKLMEYLCKLVKMPAGNLILDPFCGTGTTLEAARNCGIDAVGIDENPESCADAAKRL